MFDRTGETPDPWGAPERVAPQVKSSRYPASSIPLTSLRNRWSWTRSAKMPRSTSWSRLPKQSLMSVSTNQAAPVHTRCISRSAVWHPLPGLNPCDRSENPGS